MGKELTKEMDSLLEELIDGDILFILNQILERFELYLDLTEFGYKKYSVPRDLVNDDSSYNALEESRRQKEINALMLLKAELAKKDENKVLPFRNGSFDRRLYSTLEISNDKEYVILRVFDSITNQELAVIKITRDHKVFIRYLGELINSPEFVYEVKESMLEDGTVIGLDMDTYILCDEVYNDSIDHNLGYSNLGESVDGIYITKLSIKYDSTLGFNPNKISEINKSGNYNR